MIRDRRLHVLLLVVVLTALLGVGCGGDAAGDGEGTTATARSEARAADAETGLPLFLSKRTKAEFLERANEICRVGWNVLRKQFAHIQEKRGPRLNRKELFAFATKYNFMPHIQFWFDDITYLGLPEGEKRKEIEDMLYALQLAVFSAGERRVTDSDELSAVFSSFNRLAREYGLDECFVEGDSLA